LTDKDGAKIPGSVSHMPASISKYFISGTEGSTLRNSKLCCTPLASIPSQSTQWEDLWVPEEHARASGSSIWSRKKSQKLITFVTHADQFKNYYNAGASLFFEAS